MERPRGEGPARPPHRRRRPGQRQRAIAVAVDERGAREGLERDGDAEPLVEALERVEGLAEQRMRGRDVAFLAGEVAEIDRRPRHPHHVAGGAEQIGAALVVDPRAGQVTRRSRDVAEVVERPGLADGVPGLAEQVVGLLERRLGVRVVALPAAHVGEIAQRGGHGSAIAELPADAHALLEAGARERVVADEPVVDAEVVQLPDHAAQVAEVAVDRHRFLLGLRGLEHRRQQAAVGQGGGPGLGRPRQSRQPQQRVEAGMAFEAMAAPIPVVGEREGEAQRPVGVVRGDQMIERGPVVVVLALAARQPLVPLRG